jgi:endonuclease-3
MTKKQKAKELIGRLAELYPDAKCSLDFTNELELVAATCLSAQCTDERVNIVTKDLFAKYKTAADYRDADLAQVEEIIRSCGFYKNKAKNLIGLGRVLCEKFGGKVPGTMEELLELPGVGRKTANLVLGVVYNDQGIVADTHCIRLANRFGLTKSDDPVVVERELSALIPKDERLMFCHRLIYHGRAVCQARKPACETCTLFDLCSLQKGKKMV